MDPKSTPDPECVRMKRRAQERIADATRAMSAHERDAYVNERAAEWAKRMHWTLESTVTEQGSVVTVDHAERRAG